MNWFVYRIYDNKEKNLIASFISKPSAKQYIDLLLKDIKGFSIATSDKDKYYKSTKNIGFLVERNI